MRRYSDRFNTVFNFFIKSNRSGVLSFCGSAVNVIYDKNAKSAKECFKLFENGEYKNGKPIISSQPNLATAAITGKKSWGLWLDQWTDGIADCSFTREEILNEFSSKGIVLPDSFLADFNNKIRKKKINICEDYIKSITIIQDN